MIGDCNPHGPNYPLNTQKIDWRTECDLLKEEEVSTGCSAPPHLLMDQTSAYWIL